MEKDGALVVKLGNNWNYRGEELLMKRKRKSVLFDETLVKWSRVQDTEGGRDGPGVVDDNSKNSNKLSKSLLVWMNKEEIQACCPHLVQQMVYHSKPELINVGGAPCSLSHNDTSDSDEQEMVGDVLNLVSRAKRIMTRVSQKPSPESEKVLTNTINILSAYAKLGFLANSFRKCGALDLLLHLLSSQFLHVRRSASEMLRALSAYDSTSRSYVLLQLTQEEEGELTSMENREMLLDLFADTASQDEENIPLSDFTSLQVYNYDNISHVYYLTTPLPTHRYQVVLSTLS